jgi:hypothetical protein
MSVCIYSVFVFSYVEVAALRLADPTSKEFYRMRKKIRKLKKRQDVTKGCRTIDRWIDVQTAAFVMTVSE